MTNDLVTIFILGSDFAGRFFVSIFIWPRIELSSLEKLATEYLGKSPITLLLYDIDITLTNEYRRSYAGFTVVSLV